MRMMEHGFEKAAKLIVLLSETYQQSEHCRKEYNTFLKNDPANRNQRVIVFRVTECVATGNLATLRWTDLVPVLNDHRGAAPNGAGCAGDRQARGRSGRAAP